MVESLEKDEKLKKNREVGERLGQRVESGERLQSMIPA